jgi:hypothetical protein
VLADVLLRRAALVVRVAFDHRPDPLAGLKVDDEDLEQLLTELPGLAVTDQSVIAAIERETKPAVEAARAGLRDDLSGLPGASGTDSFCRVVRFARLSELETEVLALCCAIEVDPRRQRVVGYLNDDVGQRRLTLFTVQLLFPEYAEVALAVGPGSGLRRAALLAPLEAGPLGTVALAPSPALLWWLAGDRSRDPELPAGADHVGPMVPGYRVSGKRSPAGSEGVAFARRAGGAGLFLVPGRDRLRRRQAAAEKLGDLLATPLPGSAGAWDALVRQATFEESAVLIELDGSLPPEARQRIVQADHLSWALASAEELPLDVLPDVTWQELAVAGAQATEAEWQEVASGVQDGEDLPAGPHPGQTGPGQTNPDGPRPSQNLSAEQLELVRLAAPGVGGVHAAVRRLAAGHISELAPRIRPSRTWQDLVLDADRSQRLREVVARCRHKRTVYDSWGFSPLPSGGVVALFSGPSGTGKTLAAEIIAGELSLDLYKIDLAALVSKWVGETEKNLAQVFSAAEASNVALFFDEADAIFGKRSEVSDAHDRYANIEVAYLLQRLERYEGLVVLASNLATNIDPAFLRRVHVRVDFPMPEEPERKRIWDQSLPSTAPRADLDIGLVANLFKLSGGSIHNAALTAAFIAADAGTPITMACVVEAVQRELRKLGRLVTPGDFGPYAHLMDGRAAGAGPGAGA